MFMKENLYFDLSVKFDKFLKEKHINIEILGSCFQITYEVILRLCERPRNRFKHFMIKKINQLTVMCTTRGERRLIGFWCQKACMKSKFIISYRMMHNLIKRFRSCFTD